MTSCDELERVACPSAGACGGQFTANTMACVSEAIGLALPGSAGTPAPYETRDQYAEASGEVVMDLLAQEHPAARHRDPRARSRTRRPWSRRPAARPTPACTCRRSRTRPGSTSTCTTSARSFARTPYIADLKPAGQYVMRDLHDAGGVPMLMRALLDGGYLHGDCLTVTGRTIAENLADVRFNPDQPVIRTDLGPALAGRRRGRPQGQPRARGRASSRSPG